MKTIPIRKTKIVATIGPASDSVKILEEMIVAGMSVARLNLSHGSYTEHSQRIGLIRQASDNLRMPVAIMIDTRGVEIRTGKILQGSVELTSGDTFSIFTDGRAGDQQGVSVTYQRLHQEVNPGDVILLDDGAMELTVQSILDREVRCRVVLGGVLKENKGVNLPNTQLSMAAVEPEHRDDILQELSFAAENDVDYIAASFIQDADEVNRMRKILIEKGVDIPIIAKIENRAGINNLEAIVS
ncbi:MAG: pyruvate kinase, partial [Candidatus Thiodiazotropha endolucinida]